ncbi:hypothetical protein HanIR_Chr11g0559401 [Helianthus annuus]|nr:hypothetical protein HanIR_Chr11g0559401 [Helianthus annuus]
MKHVVRDEQMVMGTGTEFPKLNYLKYQFGTNFWRSWYRFATGFYLYIPPYQYRNQYFWYHYRFGIGWHQAHLYP